MTHFNTLKLLLLLLLCNCILLTDAQKLHILKDINESTDANPQNASSYLANTSFTTSMGLAYFSADDGIHGNELWVSDGTSAGTKIVKDITPGQSGTQIRNITRFRTGVIFSTLTSTRVYEVWVSDGTEAGTKKIYHTGESLYDIFIPALFTAVGNETIYFVATGNQLWKTDGTVAGTQMVANFNTADFGYGGAIDNLVSFNGRLFFTLITSNYGAELWSTDGTKQGTGIYKDIFPGFGGSNPIHLTVVNNTLLFFATEDGNAYKLWQTKGDAADIIAVPQSSGSQIGYTGPGIAFTFNNAMCFNGGTGLYKYVPGSADGITKLNNINANQYAVVNNNIFFIADQALWVADGSPALPTILKSEKIQNMAAVGDNLYFTIDKGVNGVELWRSGGTIANTYLVKGNFPQTSNTAPAYLTGVGNTLLFAANDGITGNELWRSDGTTGGTALLKDINKTATASASPDLSKVRQQIINNNQLLFSATTPQYGNELYVTDGTTGGTKLLKNIAPGAADGLGLNGTPIGIGPAYFTNFKSYSYFFAAKSDSILRVWRTDGTVAGTQQVDSFTQTYYSDPPQVINMIAGKNHLYYYVNRNGRGWIYSTDGNSARQLALGDMDISTIFRNPELAITGDTLFFAFGQDNTGQGFGKELWMTDGTVANTKQVKNIYADPYKSSNPTNLFAFKGKVYFSANDGTGNYLWTSDGSEAGTRLFKKVSLLQPPFVVSNYVNSNPATISGNKAFFTANDSVHGFELWVTDGTTDGTMMVKDINSGAGHGRVGNMVDVNGMLYFFADDGVHGEELWKSDGTAAGTVMVKDMAPGKVDAYGYCMTAGKNNLLYFYYNMAIWQSDGTVQGTKAVDDFTLSGINTFGGMFIVNDKVIVSGSSYQYGGELFSATTAALPVTLLSFTGALVKNDAQLTWKTANEVNSDYFIIERSFTGTAFNNIGKIMAAGNTATEHIYKLTDADVTSLGTNTLYYRLQQVDKDGKRTYSNVIMLTVNNIDITVGPNPAHNTAYLRSSVNINNATVVLTDMNGHVLYTAKQSLQAGVQVPINVSGFAAGIYNVSIQAANIPARQFKLALQ